MKNFLIKSARYTTRQGFFNGITALIKLRKKDGLIKIIPRNTRSPVWLRAKTSDVPTFDEIFVANHYDFPYGFVPKNIVDCGANIGLTTVYYKNLFPASTIIAVEPELSNFEMLEKNVAGLPNVHCVYAGIWNREATLQGSEKYGTEKWLFSVEEAKNGNCNCTLPAITINAILEKFNLKEIGILKIDIEGAELELFSNNFENWLPKTRCIVIELHDRLRAGAGTAFFKATSAYNFSYYQNGVNIFCINNALQAIEG